MAKSSVDDSKLSKSALRRKRRKEREGDGEAEPTVTKPDVAKVTPAPVPAPATSAWNTIVAAPPPPPTDTPSTVPPGKVSTVMNSASSDTSVTPSVSEPAQASELSSQFQSFVSAVGLSTTGLSTQSQSPPQPVPQPQPLQAANDTNMGFFSQLLDPSVSSSNKVSEDTLSSSPAPPGFMGGQMQAPPPPNTATAAPVPSQANIPMNSGGLGDLSLYGSNAPSASLFPLQSQQPLNSGLQQQQQHSGLWGGNGRGDTLSGNSYLQQPLHNSISNPIGTGFNNPNPNANQGPGNDRFGGLGMRAGQGQVSGGGMNGGNGSYFSSALGGNDNAGYQGMGSMLGGFSSLMNNHGNQQNDPQNLGNNSQYSNYSSLTQQPQGQNMNQGLNQNQGSLGRLSGMSVQDNSLSSLLNSNTHGYSSNTDYYSKYVVNKDDSRNGNLGQAPRNGNQQTYGNY